MLAITLALGASAAQAGVVFSDDFNASGFVGSGSFSSTSDRFGPTLYRNINNFNGWTFTGNSALATKIGSTDSAILLNEGPPLAGMSRTLTGLVVGQSYNLQFLLSGDNIPGGGYGLETYIGGTLLQTTFGVDGASGTNPGSLKSVNFTAASTSTTLAFQAIFGPSGNSSASPVLDNVVVSTADIPEPTSAALVGAALLGLAAARRRRMAA